MFPKCCSEAGPLLQITLFDFIAIKVYSKFGLGNNSINFKTIKKNFYVDSYKLIKTWKTSYRAL